MPDFLRNIPVSHANVSPGFVETLIQSRREELFTGIMRLQYPAGDTFVFTFLDGLQQKLYRYLEKNTEIIPRQSWVNTLDRQDASVAFMPMALESLRLMQVAHEAPILRVEDQTLTPQQLTSQVASWAKATQPAVLHLRAEHFDRIYLVSGITNPVIEEVAMANGSSSFSINDASFPASLPLFTSCQVVRYVSDLEHDTWQEYELRLAFHPLIRLLLNRFSELAGRILTERLCQQISDWLREEGWNIKVSINGVASHQLFESIEQAVDACVGIIRCFHEEASPAIGLRMAEGLSRDVLLKLDPYRRETLMRHIYNQNRLDTVTGRVWR